MTIFAVIGQAPQGPEGTLADGIRKEFPGQHYDLGYGDWLISAQATAQEVSDRLGITDGLRGTGIVVEIGSYFGRTNPAVWTWIKTNWEGRPSG